ncbi:MAG: peptide ABC transporter substrate-binding protein [Chloroflexi bacterium]|nr:peptide ABC transporter substrate-binding protein [Chloroflexota bacterium]MDA8187894.1 peptide ABC transporter substrate-binding protein [Dehalococcoidales bacterium]
MSEVSKPAKLSVTLALVVLSSLSLAGCTTSLPVAKPTASVSKPTTSSLYGGTLTIRLPSYAAVISPVSTDPSAQLVSRLLFSGLTRLNAHLLPVPDLAESWEISPDETTWTFSLRKDLKWHDGVPLTSDDVVFTYQTLMRLEPTSAAEFDIQQNVSRVEKVDASTVKIVLRRRFAPLAADTSVPILPEHLARNIPDAQLRKTSITVGTGPFKLQEQRDGQAIVLEANPNYHHGRPYIDKVAFLVAGSDEATTKALKDGRLMLAQMDGSDIGDLTNDSRIDLNDFSEQGFFFVGFNLRKGRIFEDRNLRLAWTYGIDKEALVKTVTKGQGIPLWSDVPPVSWAYDPTVPKTNRDVAKAKQLLGDSGWKDADGDGILEKAGKKLSVELLVRDDAADRIQAAQVMSQQLRGIGMDVKVVQADFSSVLAAKRKPPFDFDAILMGWTLGGDPDDYSLFHSSQIPTEDKPNRLNFVGFKNEDFDQLTSEARKTLDVKKRKDLYRGTQRLLAQEVPYHFLWANKITIARSKRLQGPIELTSPAYLWNVEKWYISRP